MRDVDYAFRKELKGTAYADAVERVTDALKSEGFGVLTSIDVRSTLKEKLGIDFKNYLIIGACNPQLALQALTADESIGLLLPCNVVVSETDRGAEVAIARPGVMLSLADSPGAEAVATEAEKRLARVLEKV